MATGKRFLDEWVGTYSDEAGARQRIGAVGGAEELFTSYLGDPIMPDMAMRGDIGVKGFDGWHIAMICTGQMWAAKRLKGGISMLRIVPDMAWSVRG